MARMMFALRGVAGCGKSTFIDENGLNDFVISSDKFRDMIYPTCHVLGEDTDGYIGGGEKMIAHMTREAVEYRMSRGATIILDNTNISPKSIRSYAHLASQYDYEFFLVDMMNSIDETTLIARQSSRGAKAVPAEVVSRMYAQYINPHTIKALSCYTTLTGDEMIAKIHTLYEVNADGYDEVVFIGDIHGHAHELEKTLNAHGGLDNDKALFVFTGDLFERGYDDVTVYTIIAGHMWRDNVIVCEGNHEHNIRGIINGTVGEGSLAKTRATMNTLADNGISYQSIKKKFVKNLVPYVVIRNASTAMNVVACHGGVSLAEEWEEDIIHMSDHEFIYGTSTRDKSYMGRSTYDESITGLKIAGNVIMVHGHRNPVRGGVLEPFDTSNSINLEAGVGGVYGDDSHVIHGALRSATFSMGQNAVIDIPVED